MAGDTLTGPPNSVPVGRGWPGLGEREGVLWKRRHSVLSPGGEHVCFSEEQRKAVHS